MTNYGKHGVPASSNKRPAESSQTSSGRASTNPALHAGYAKSDEYSNSYINSEYFPSDEQTDNEYYPSGYLSGETSEYPSGGTSNCPFEYPSTALELYQSDEFKKYSRYAQYSATEKSFFATDDATNKKGKKKIGILESKEYKENKVNEAYKENKANKINTGKKSGSGRGKKIAIRVAIGLAITVVVAAIALVIGVTWLDRQLQGNKSDEELLALKESMTQNKNLEEPFHVLLIGTDEREGNPNYGSRSDVIILVRVDPIDYVVTMVSIQRDTLVTTSDGRNLKFNAIYGSGGASACVKAVSNLCGVDIDYYAEVNFTGVTNLIDALGGVDVEIAQTIDDWRAGDEVIEAGWQHLNGKQALIVARARHYGDGDYTRSSYQRVITQSLINKVLAAKLTDIPSIITSAVKCVSTSFTAGDIYSLALHFKDAENITFYSANLPSTGIMIDGISYVEVVEKLKKEMMEEVEAGRDPNNTHISGYHVTIESSVLGKAAQYDEDGNRITE